MKTRGTAFRYGDNVDTDVIIPARYLNTQDANELATHCMEDIDQEFARTVKSGDIVVAGRNFGCGSSREHAPLAIKACGVGCVVAASFARIFYRNALNIGLPILECPAAAEAVEAGHTVTVDFVAGEITDETTGQRFAVEPFPPFMRDLVSAGGLANYLRNRKQPEIWRAAVSAAADGTQPNDVEGLPGKRRSRCCQATASGRRRLARR